MEIVSILSDPDKKIQLIPEGEIRFGPSLYSLKLDRPHLLEERMFFNNFSLSKDLSRVVLAEYIPTTIAYKTRLIILDLIGMRYSVLIESEKVLRPSDFKGDLFHYTVSNSGLTTEHEIVLSDDINWSAIYKADTANPEEVLRKYGYQLSSTTDKKLVIVLLYHKKNLASLIFTAILAIGFLTYALVVTAGGFEPFLIVAIIVSSILLVTILMAILQKALFRLEVSSKSVCKHFFKRSCYNANQIKEFRIQYEEIFKYRSSAIESYTWYLLIRLNDNRSINLLHCNNISKDKGRKDLDNIINLLQSYQRIPVNES